MDYEMELKNFFNEINQLLYFYKLFNSQINVDDNINLICSFIDKLLINPLYESKIKKILINYETYSNKVKKDLNELKLYMEKEIPSKVEYAYPSYPLKRQCNIDFLYTIKNSLTYRFKESYLKTSHNHHCIANYINIYLDELTIRINYIKNEIIKIELCINKSKKSKSTDILSILNQNNMNNYIEYKKLLNFWLKKHSELVYDSTINFNSNSPSKYYEIINNYQTTLNSSYYSSIKRELVLNLLIEL